MEKRIRDFVQDLRTTGVLMLMLLKKTSKQQKIS